MARDLSRINPAYMAVRHLTTSDAARQLGKSYQSVKEYRERHPETAYAPKVSQQAQRPGIVQLCIPMFEPSRAISDREARTMMVSVKAPPSHLNITFARHGVSV